MAIVGQIFPQPIPGSSSGSAGGVNTQTGASYTFVSGDLGKLVTFSNASPVAVTLPVASGFATTWFVDVENLGAGIVTITPTTSSIDGAGSIVLTQNQGITIFGNGTNYFTQRGRVITTGSAAGQIPIWDNTAKKWVPATLTAGANVTITDADASVTVASSGGGGGGMVLLEQHTAAVSATLDFTTCISSTYDEYVIEMLNLLPATNAQNLLLLVSTNGGSTYDSTAGNYRYAYDLRFSTSASSFGGFSATAGSLIPTAGIYNGAGSFGVSGTIHLHNPMQSTMTKTVNFHIANVDNNHTADVEYIVGSGMYSVSGSAVNAFRFVFASGNITSGTVRVYGVSK